MEAMIRVYYGERGIVLPNNVVSEIMERLGDVVETLKTYARVE